MLRACEGKEGQQCTTRHGLAPIVQNKFRGLRYCGKRSPDNYKWVVRPEKQDDGSFACPGAFEACSKGFFDVPGGEEYVVCFDDNVVGKERKSVCPITSVAFSYNEIEGDKSKYQGRAFEIPGEG